MKKTILFFLLSLSGMVINAQSYNIPYYSQPELKKFEGEWIYKTDVNSFKIMLKVEKTYIKGQNPVYMDFIVGYHLYNRNKDVVQSSYGKDITISSGGFEDRNNKNKIKFLITDLARPTDSGAPSERGSLELLTDSTAIWRIRPGEAIKLNGKGFKKDDYGIYIPQYLILKKVH